MINKILVPVDGSPHADHAIDLASELALKFAAHVIVLHVVPERSMAEASRGLRAFAENERTDIGELEVAQALGSPVAEEAERRARSLGVRDVEYLVVAGDPAEAILGEAENLGVDLIVMGRRGLGRLTGLLLGSVSAKVIQLAKCPCLTVR